jgi:hypothetical protein
MRMTPWVKVVVTAYILAEFSDKKGQRFLCIVLADKTSGNLPVATTVTKDKIVGNNVRLTISKKEQGFVISEIETEKTPSFIDNVELPTIGIFRSRKE